MWQALNPNTRPPVRDRLEMRIGAKRIKLEIHVFIIWVSQQEIQAIIDVTLCCWITVFYLRGGNHELQIVHSDFVPKQRLRPIPITPQDGRQTLQINSLCWECIDGCSVQNSRINSPKWNAYKFIVPGSGLWPTTDHIQNFDRVNSVSKSKIELKLIERTPSPGSEGNRAQKADSHSLNSRFNLCWAFSTWFYFMFFGKAFMTFVYIGKWFFIRIWLIKFLSMVVCWVVVLRLSRCLFWGNMSGLF